MRLPWLLSLLLAVVCTTLFFVDKEARHRGRAELARARDEAAAAYEAALMRTTNEAERRFLTRRLTSVRAARTAPRPASE